MKEFPGQPFTTADFSPEGGGIDFLGLRWVGLTMVGNDLVPQINNVTRDMGMFFLGAWIPWKFHELCKSAPKKLFTQRNFRDFREKVEVAISATFKAEYHGRRRHGHASLPIGIRQSAQLPYRACFKAAGRTSATSLYAAALYGPAFRALGLIQAYRVQSQEGPAVNIPLVSDERDVGRIVSSVDRCLRKSKRYDFLDTLDVPQVEWKDVRKLGEAGLDPTLYRDAEHSDLKAIFRRMLLPPSSESPGFARTLTTRLLLDTIRHRKDVDATQVRDAWYTGLWHEGKPLRITNGALGEQRRKWACFMARQYQRYALELFLWCFEKALANKCSSVDEAVGFWSTKLKVAGVGPTATLGALINKVAGDCQGASDEQTSARWNNRVHAGDDRFEYVDDPCTNDGAGRGLRMLAGWYLRMLTWRADDRNKSEMDLGGADRMGMGWLVEWLRARRERPLRELLRDIFADLVFSQHMRVALSRFDGATQRLRFLLGDRGIEATVSARADLATRFAPMMPDRLDALISLLCDVDVLTRDKEGLIRAGPCADAACAS